jgi:transposase InsO family protein
MPWPSESSVLVRERFALAALAGGESFAKICRRFHIARSTGYKWLRRYRERGRSGLRERSRRPLRSPRRIRSRWLKALRQLRRCHPSWGPRKLRAHLRALHPRVHLPSARTLARWLQRMGLVSLKRRRQRRGPWLKSASRVAGRRPNDVWTIDFKGWFRIQDGCRIDPLTVRDLKSRFILDIRLVPNQTYEAIRPALQRVFTRYGLPRAIRVDNGPPFGGPSPRGLSRLAVWWRRLGIKVDYGRPAHPEDNAAHEQMHRVYQAEVLAHPAGNRAILQRRSDRWRAQYNHIRPHEALGLRPPAQGYQPSSRVLPRKLPPWTYPAGWLIRNVNRNGRLYWMGRLRFVGEAFSRERIGLRPTAKGTWKVFLGQDLLGFIHPKDQSTSLRPVQLRYL